MWETSTLRTPANEDLGTLAEYDLSQLLILCSLQVDFALIPIPHVVSHSF